MIRSFVKILSAVLLFFAIAGLSAYFTLTRVIQSEDTVMVPNLTGRDAVYALQVLTELGLNTKIKGAEYSSNIPQNHIIAQDPGPGEMIKKGRDIRLILSKGVQSVSAPNLEGLDLEQARLILEQNGIIEGVLSKAYNKMAGEGSVIAQDPPSGATLNRGEAVNLLVSLGPRPEEYRMPDVKNLSLDRAVDLIKKNKLEIGMIKPVYLSDSPPNLVVGQDPPSGYRVKTGERINLEVNQMRAGNPFGGGNGSNSGLLFRYRLPMGFLKQHIRLELMISGFTCTLHDQLMRPGTEVWALVPNQPDSMIFLYKNDLLIDTKFFDRSVLQGLPLLQENSL